MFLKVLALSILMSTIGCGKKSEDSPVSAPVVERPTVKRIIVDESHRKELYNAIISNDSLLVDYALKENNDINFHFVDGETPLTKAIGQGNNNDIIITLINHNVDLDLPNKLHQTPLNLAIRSKNYNIVHALIDRNADINKIGYNQMSPLENAIYFSNETESIYLVRRGANFNYIGESGLSMLDLASLQSYSRLEKLILKAKVHKEVSIKNIKEVITQGDTSFIKYLVTRYPEYIDLINQKNMLLDVLVLKNEIQRRFMLDFLLESGVSAHNELKETPLIFAIKNDLLDEMNKLILKGAMINYKDEENKDAFIISVELLHYNITKKLYRILREEINNSSILFRDKAEEEFRERMWGACYHVPQKRNAGWMHSNGKELRTRTKRLLRCN